MNIYYFKYLKYKKKYMNNKFILNGGMIEQSFELHGTMLTADVPNDFVCSLSWQIMVDPVITFDGFTYERSEITDWFTHNHTNPTTN